MRSHGAGSGGNLGACAKISAQMFALPVLLSAVLLAPEPPREMRGLWVVRTALVSPEAVDRAVDEAAEAGFGALFVQVRGRGDAFYDSRIVARSPLLAKQPASFDPLARLIERARSKDIEVHVWINVLLAAGFAQPPPADHVVAQHPDWVMVSKAAAVNALRPRAPILKLVKDAARNDPDVEGYYLSPASPAVGEHLEKVVREIVRGYPVTGLHLDFIRYPNKDFDYSRSTLSAFGIRQKTKQPLQAALASPGTYAEFRREALTALAARLAQAARQERPGLCVSSAVVPDEAAALAQKFQDWPAWSARGILDAVVLMTYTADNRIFREQVAQARSLVPQKPVWAGVGTYRLPLDGTLEKIALARQAGANGVVLFSHESLQNADKAVDRRRLHDEAFARPAGSGGTSLAR